MSISEQQGPGPDYEFRLPGNGVEVKTATQVESLPEARTFVPAGWTYLSHGTSKVEWPDTDFETTPEIEVKGLGLSAVSREMIEEDVRLLGRSNTSSLYAKNRNKPTGMSDEDFARLSIPIELRVVFYPNSASARFESDHWKSLPKATRDLVARYYYNNYQRGRHPLIPRGERLQFLGKESADDGHGIYYYVPASVSNDYLAAMGME